MVRRRTALLPWTGASEWGALRADLVALAAPGTPHAKLRTAQRMLRTYSVYQQF